MNLQRLQLHHVPVFTPRFLSHHHQPKHPFKQKHNLSFTFSFPFFFSPNFQRPTNYVPLELSKLETPKSRNLEGSMEIIEKEEEEEEEDLSVDSPVYQSTLRLVECSMFAALSGLVYFLSNSLSIENYFGCFFAFPIVLSSMRWGIAAGRKTMVATTILLLVISGPLKALTYLLMHGFLGFTLGSLWRSGASWKLSIFLCTLVRATCSMGYVLITSFLIRENILDLITINIHASLSFLFTAAGINTVPSMNFIYVIFGTVLLLNSVFLVFLLHLLYSVFLTRLGMKGSLKLPRWLDKAI